MRTCIGVKYRELSRVIKKTPNFIFSAKHFAWLGKKQSPALGGQTRAG